LAVCPSLLEAGASRSIKKTFARARQTRVRANIIPGRNGPPPRSHVFRPPPGQNSRSFLPSVLAGAERTLEPYCPNNSAKMHTVVQIRGKR